MNELIKVETNSKGQQLVSARELYDFLGYEKSQWSRWYKRNIEDNGFALEMVDYEGFDRMANGNITKDFVLTINFAKKLAMMAKTEKGEEAREYFLKCEKVALQKTIPSYQIEDPIERAKKWIDEQEEKKLALQQVDNLNTVLDNLLDWVSIIKVCQHNKVKEKLFDWRTLKSKSKELGYALKKAESPRFGYQNLYHIDVFKACYPQFNYDLKK